jgi:hypothetical protein
MFLQIFSKICCQASQTTLPKIHNGNSGVECVTAVCFRVHQVVSVSFSVYTFETLN